MKRNTFFQKITYFLGMHKVKYFISTGIEQLVIVLCLNIVIAYAAQYAVFAAERHNISYIYDAIRLIAIAMVVAMVVIPVAGYCSNKCVKEVIAECKYDFYQHVLLLNKKEMGMYHAGNIISFFSDDMKQVEDLYSEKLKQIISVCFIGPISIGAIVTMNWILGVTVFVLGICSIVFTRICANKNKALSKKVQDKKSGASSRLMDLLNGLEDTKMLGISDEVHEKYSVCCNTVEKLTKTRGIVESILALFTGFMYYFKQIIIISIGIALIKSGHFTAGELVASAYLLSNAGYMFDNIGVFYAEIQKCLVSVERIDQFLKVQEENQTADEPKEISNKKINNDMVTFENVEFSYREDKKILNQFNLNIQKNEYCAIVGPSGSGKSTIIKILLGFYGINEGILTIDGAAIQTYSLHQLREKSAYVPQEPYLFPGTIMENIKYGNKIASDEDAIKASKEALCHQFILEFANGYETLVGGDVNLSGGQIQRIAIARALLKNASILLLDEPTAALDAQSEKLVLETLNALRNRITIIIITHKMYTISDCDKIFVMSNGRIVTCGSYQQILQDEAYQSFLACES